MGADPVPELSSDKQRSAITGAPSRTWDVSAMAVWPSGSPPRPFAGTLIKHFTMRRSEMCSTGSPVIGLAFVSVIEPTL
jgi:hypothetical protein